MRKHGSKRSLLKFSVSFALMLLAAPLAASDLGRVEDRLPNSLTGQAGDPARGRAVVLNRAVSACLLCHSGPFPEAPFQGNLAPTLAGVGERLDAGQIRLRLVDPTLLDPRSIMPSYFKIDGLNRVGPTWRGKTILSAEQLEDVVAYLVTLQ